MADKNFDRLDFQIERIRETTRYTAKRFRTMAEDIDRLADVEDYTKIPGELMSLILWGVANARPDSPSMQLRELMISDAADATIAAREAETQKDAESDRLTPQEIAERVTTGSVGGHSGISDNTRRIAYNAALEAILIDRAEPCSECGRTLQHKFGCSQRSGRGYVLPATRLTEGEDAR